MSQSPETAPAALPYIYKNPFAGSDLVEGDTFGHGEDLTPRPGLVVEGRSDDIFETMPNEGIVRSEFVDDIDITDNRTPETGVEDGLLSAEANEISEADQTGRLARMGSFVTSKFVELKTSAKESISNGVKKHPKLSKLATGMAVLALAGGVAEQATGDPVNQKASASTSALTGNTLKQACVKEGLLMPKLTNANMKNPGRKGNYQTQSVGIMADYGALNPSCNGKFRRVSDVKFQLQNYKNHNQWINMDHPKWSTMWAQNGAILSGANFTGNNHQNDNIYYKCTPGSSKTEARAVVRNRVKDLATGKFVGAKYVKQPLKVEGGGC